MKFLYGGDYNPEQWMRTPEVLDQDIALMKEAGCNVMSIGIFGWSVMEPREGEYDFSFYENVINRLYENGIRTILATPSAAMPSWLSKKYPEVLRTDEEGRKHRQGGRQNHCFTSPVYRRKVREINEQLAMKFKDNPAIYAIHVSNEYYADCHCELCAQAFREFLKEKYHNDLDKLNYEWWNAFWSHTYGDWEEIEPPMTIGESGSNALMLNWKRFVTHQTIDFYENECEPFRRIAPGIPLTTNFHGIKELDYYQFAQHVDFVCWDAYPFWHSPQGNLKTAAGAAFIYDACRAMKQKPFLLMESTPSNVNWAEYCKLKRPGMNMLSSMQAVAGGADSVQYFQWRKSRGSCEQFHGAVVDHCGHGNTRVFREAAEIGAELNRITGIRGSAVKAEAAVICDYQNRWALNGAQGFQNKDKKYDEECLKHYRYFFENGINTDVIDSSGDFSRYQVIAAPMLYMLRDDVAERLCEFVRNGGTLVSGFMSGYVNGDNLCYLGGFPGGKLRELFGIWNEEIDTLYPEDKNSVAFQGKEYTAFDYCEILHTETAEVLGEYREDFYAGTPAITVNQYGKGKAYYVAFRGNDEFVDALYRFIQPKVTTAREEIDFPDGVTVRVREDALWKYFFIQNWNETGVEIILKSDFQAIDSDEKLEGRVWLDTYQTLVCKKRIFPVKVQPVYI